MSRIVRIPGSGSPGPPGALVSSGSDAELVARVTARGDNSLPTILYLHGFGSSQDGEKAELFRDRAAAAGYGFVSLDFQGHGRSGGEMLGLTLSRCLADVARVRLRVPELEGRVSLIGSSMGGLVGLWHAVTADPRRAVGALALIAPALGLDTTLRDLLGGKGIERWRGEGSLEVTNELGTFELGWGFMEDLAAYSTEDLVARYLARAAPAIIFQGKLDDRVSWKEVAGFVEKARNREANPRSASRAIHLELFEDGDHRLVDRMDWICAESLRFVGERNPGHPGDVE